jgi:hypothetical protein
MNLFKILGGLGIDPKDVFQNVLTATTPGLAKPQLLKFLTERVSDAGCQKLGRLCSLAGEKLQKLDRAGAAGDLSRVIGEIKFF